MSPRRERGAWLVGALALTGMVWATGSAVIVVSVLRPSPVIHQGEPHADQ